jgi:NADH:ubiquinone oxidoreductase subunit 2 (subunit N)
MASGAVAAFFYLRLAVTMFSPVGLVGDVAEGDRTLPDQPTPAPVERGSSGDQPASIQVLTDDAPEIAVESRGLVPVPALTAVAIGICVAFTVVFGIIPGPIVNFAHQATLLLLH